MIRKLFPIYNEIFLGVTARAYFYLMFCEVSDKSHIFPDNSDHLFNDYVACDK